MVAPVVHAPTVQGARSGGATRRGSPGSGLREVSDLIVSYDRSTGRRLPVHRDVVVDELLVAGDRRAAATVARMPVDAAGVLLAPAVDALLIRMHVQLQRLWEELGLGPVVVELLVPLLDAIRSGATGHRRLRVVDVGCGLGYLIRWAACTGALGPDVELVGCDLDRTLVLEARRLAEVEGLVCRFEAADALSLPGGADVYVSSGLLHHLGAPELPAFFAGQTDAGGFLHWDTARTWLAPIGSWAFHRARMRDPLARHDGVRSVQRAHPDRTLAEAVAQGAPTMATGLYGLPDRRLPLLDVIRPVVGVRAGVAGAFMDRLGTRSRRLVPCGGPW